MKSHSDLHLLYTAVESNIQEARLLRSAGTHGAAGSDEEVDEDDDVDYAPGEDEWRKTIMIGSDYQANVPLGLSPYENSQTLPYENEDKLLWSPYVHPDVDIEDYLQRCAQIQQHFLQERITAATVSQPHQTVALLSTLPLGAHVRDDEQALHQLLQCGYNMDEALRRRKMSSVAPCDTVSLWSEEECRNFESGLRVFGKDFHHIQQQKVWNPLTNNEDIDEHAADCGDDTSGQILSAAAAAAAAAATVLPVSECISPSNREQYS